VSRGDVLLHSARLAHQKGFAEVATGLLRDSFGQLGWKEQALLFADRCQNTADLADDNTTGDEESGFFLHRENLGARQSRFPRTPMTNPERLRQKKVCDGKNK